MLGLVQGGGGSSWWDAISGIGSLAAALAAVGIALSDHRRYRHQERKRERESHLRDLDETRLMILAGPTPADGGRSATVVNALRWHSGLLTTDDDVAQFQHDWVRFVATEGKGGAKVLEILEAIRRREEALREA